jgi:hypothetical protein
MRTLVMVVGVVVLGLGGAACSGRKRVTVANTPEGNACRRECMALFNDCQDGKRKNRKVCLARENECLTTCPGAVLGGEGDAAAPAAPPPAPVAQPMSPTEGAPSCVAEQLPEWQSADAVTKKALLERCRAPAAPPPAPPAPAAP